MRFAGSRVLMGLMLATMAVPFQLTMIPTFLVMKKLGLTPTPWRAYRAVAGHAVGDPAGQQFFLCCPGSWRRPPGSTAVHGGRRWWRIVLPLSRPCWPRWPCSPLTDSNDLTWLLIAINHDTQYTLQLGLTTFQGQHHTQWAAVMAGNVITVLPVLLAFLGAQKTFIQSITSSGLKG
ncbi:carbohydrate ABC transporter permease [Streptomyces violaceorubidus]